MDEKGNMKKKKFNYVPIVVCSLSFVLIIVCFVLETIRGANDIYQHIRTILLLFLSIYGTFSIRDYIDDIITNPNEYRNYLVNELLSQPNNNENISHTVNLEKNKDSKDIIALMLKNNDELTEYFQISKKQSHWSFILSALACISGIIILGITVYSVIILKQTDIAVIGVISGAIVELIAGTIFWLHNKSALQLNHYYDALHENEKVLLAINLINTLSTEERENMCKEIIRTQIYKQKIDK